MAKHQRKNHCMATLDLLPLQEIEMRAPIEKNMKFLDDNRVWKILYATSKDTHCFTQNKKFQKQQDGREAYLALYDNLLGCKAIQNQTCKAENQLQSLSWDGKVKKGLNFDKYILAHEDQHIILEKLTELDYSGIDENLKIWYFNQGIMDPALNPVKASLAVNASADMFDLVVGAYKTYITRQRLHSKTWVKEVNILAINQFTGNQTKDKSRKVDAKEDQYDPNADYSAHKIPPHQFYKADEWNKLKRGQRNYLKQTP